MQYWLYVDEHVTGPYSAVDLKGLGITRNTFVCPEGTESWVEAGNLPELAEIFAGSDHPDNFPMPDPHPGERKKIFIIHGKGIRLMTAFRILIRLLETKIIYEENKYLVSTDQLRLLRYVIYESSSMHTNKLLAALDRLLASRILIAPFFPLEVPADGDLSPLSQFKVNDKIKSIASEYPNAEGRELADLVFRDALNRFRDILGDFPVDDHHTLAEELTAFVSELESERKLLEEEAKAILWNRIDAKGGSGESLVNGLLEIQRNFEVGGDLDTVGSNAVYGAWLLHHYRSNYGKDPVYGVDYEFDFVNYQESFLHLTRHGNCDIYIPDFPLDAIPDLEDSARAVLSVGSIYKGFDDHHPFTPEALDTLQRLKAEGVIEHFALSGPPKGEEQPKEVQKCGTDLIYEKFVKGTPADNPGIAELTRLAHLQDLHIEENKLAIDLSKLIGSKFSKFNMVQTLMKLQTKQEMDDILEDTGWKLNVLAYERELEQHCPKILKNLVLVEFITPAPENNFAAGLRGFRKLACNVVKILTFGMVNIARKLYMSDPRYRHRVYMALSPFQSAKEARINVAAAINFLKERVSMDYFFYCYGSSLMTTRKVNEMDSAFDLSVLCSKVGGPDDGGHASAATCKPTKNPSFPHNRFDRVNGKNFTDYAGYIASKIRENFNVEVARVEKVALQQ